MPRRSKKTAEGSQDGDTTSKTPKTKVKSENIEKMSKKMAKLAMDLSDHGSDEEEELREQSKKGCNMSYVSICVLDFIHTQSLIKLIERQLT